MVFTLDDRPLLSTPSSRARAIGSRLKAARLAADLSVEQLAARAGTSGTTVSRIERGLTEKPGYPLLQRLALALGHRTVDEWLAGIPPSTPPVLNVVGNRSVEERRALSGVRPRAVYRWGAAGNPMDPDDAPLPDREEHPPIGAELLLGPNGFGVDVRGSSMVRRNILDGDTVWVAPDKPARPGQIVVAYARDCRDEHGQRENGVVVKVLARGPGGGYVLCSDGDPPHGRAPLDCAEFRVIGPVVRVTRSFVPE